MILLCCTLNPTEKCVFCNKLFCDMHFRIRQTLAFERREKGFGWGIADGVDPCSPGYSRGDFAFDGHYLAGLNCNMMPRRDKINGF